MIYRSASQTTTHNMQCNIIHALFIKEAYYSFPLALFNQLEKLEAAKAA